jgi:hypothetical protein
LFGRFWASEEGSGAADDPETELSLCARLSVKVETIEGS